MDSTELPSSSTRVFDGSEELAGTHEKFDQSTEEVLIAVGSTNCWLWKWIMRRHFRQRKFITV